MLLVLLLLGGAGCRVRRPGRGRGSGRLSPHLTRLTRCGAAAPVCFPSQQFRTVSRAAAELFVSPMLQMSGMCNSLVEPGRGAAGARLGRLLAPHYSDCQGAPRGSGAGNCPHSATRLPGAREVSSALHPDRDRPQSRCRLHPLPLLNVL